MLHEERIDPEILVAAMVRDEIDHHPLQPDLPPDEQERITADVDAAVHQPNVEASAARQRRCTTSVTAIVTSSPEWTSPNPRSCTQATRVLADAGLDIDAIP